MKTMLETSLRKMEPDTGKEFSIVGLPKIMDSLLNQNWNKTLPHNCEAVMWSSKKTGL
jgi:hypothetical protein